MHNPKLELIYREISNLTNNEKKTLLSILISEIKLQSNNTERSSILDLKGVGKEIWQEIDAQGYVNNERSSWNI